MGLGFIDVGCLAFGFSIGRNMTLAKLFHTRCVDMRVAVVH